ncbi:MAG: acetate--CoA ligase [alpha proteobacterium MED-G10]|jgi:acetyl-CoA synthetase|nr:MAG: acetate--CoA ligase [alpha proteobacterium MED-G10]|tara:strand:+ start:1017 stop:2927 length:1911 start_codon:yes stop_codon:yes gene_type:complete
MSFIENKISDPSLDLKEYLREYKRSIEDPEDFWNEKASSINWIKKYSKIKESSFNDDVSIKWFSDGSLNVSENCIDRHLKDRGDKVAIIWQGDEPGEHKKITYKELHREVCKLANGLKSLGVKKGDRVTIYLPMIPEAAYAMLACSRIGAIHSVVFGGFAPESLKDRVMDCSSNTIITANEGIRGGKKIPLLSNVRKAIQGLEIVKNVIVVNRTNKETAFSDKEISYTSLVSEQAEVCSIVEQNSEDPLFILYTSGSTGKPKGVLHTTAGYLLHASISHRTVFSIKENDIYWCTADVGWVTGHSYIVYGPLCNGSTTLMFEGVPTYPDASRFWEIVDKFNVTIFYTAPTAIRALMGLGDSYVNKASLSSLRILGTVGEPINPEAWNWYYEIIGKKKCPVVDTWWQTETGGILISPIAGTTPLKPGSATLPFFGVNPIIVDNEGNELSGECEGNLCITTSWPGMMRTVYRNHKRFVETYFSSFKGKYFTGDGCKRDKDGYYWITGRVDDVINVSGHRLGTAEVESALVLHKKVSEAGVVGYPHDIKGQGIYAYVTLMTGEKYTDELKNDLKNWVRSVIGPIATPDIIHWAPELPKTRSGKIMRRILRKVACNEEDSIGDTSTLNEPGVVDILIKNRG